MLEQDDALAAETASQEDKYVAGLEGRADTSRVDRFADLTGMVLANDPSSGDSKWDSGLGCCRFIKAGLSVYMSAMGGCTKR